MEQHTFTSAAVLRGAVLCGGAAVVISDRGFGRASLSLAPAEPVWRREGGASARRAALLRRVPAGRYGAAVEQGRTGWPAVGRRLSRPAGTRIVLDRDPNLDLRLCQWPSPARARGRYAAGVAGRGGARNTCCLPMNMMAPREGREPQSSKVLANGNRLEFLCPFFG